MTGGGDGAAGGVAGDGAPTGGPRGDGGAGGDDAGEAHRVVQRRTRVGISAHLADLVARVEAHAARLRTAGDPGVAGLAQQARTETARRSLRLDASPVTDETADAVERGEMGVAAEGGVGAGAGGSGSEAGGSGSEAGGSGSGAGPGASTAGGWAAALRLDGLGTQDVAAIEYGGCLGAIDAEAELAERLFAEPHATLVALHQRLTAGLVDPVRADRGRTTDQAVHDGAQGQLLFSLPDPVVARARLAALCEWLGQGSVSVPTPVLAGVVHECLVEWQPFEGAGGRLARAAARLVLRARGLDPYGALVLDRRGSVDPTAYHRQVAATIRRRGDLAPWLEWWLEGVALTAEATADAALGVRTAVPPRLGQWLADSPSATVTVPEYAAAVGCSPEEAAGELRAGQRAAAVHADPGTWGLRFRVGAAPELEAAPELS